MDSYYLSSINIIYINLKTNLDDISTAVYSLKKSTIPNYRVSEKISAHKVNILIGVMCLGLYSYLVYLTLRRSSNIKNQLKCYLIQ